MKTALLQFLTQLTDSFPPTLQVLMCGNDMCYNNFCGFKKKYVKDVKEKVQWQVSASEVYCYYNYCCCYYDDDSILQTF